MIYELDRFNRATEPDFQEALRLYARLIPGQIRTQSNEIAYWLDNYSEFHPDEFCVCGLYGNSSIIGYAQFVYLRSDRLLFFDYFLLHEDFRNHGEYLQFIEMLKIWIYEQNWEVDYIATEVVYGYGCQAPNETPPLVRLLHKAGFAVANSLYLQPQLGIDNIQSDIKAHLLIRTTEKMLMIPSNVFLRIVDAIYFRHYKRWYDPFLDPKIEYDELLRKRYTEVEKEAKRHPMIELNGIAATILPVSAPPPGRSKRRSSVSHAALVAALVLTGCFALLLFQKVFSRDLTTIMTFLAGSLVVATTAFALFYNRGERVLAQILKFISSPPSSRKKK